MSAGTWPQALESPQRALKTLLLTDFVDSTALVESVGDDRAAQIFTRCDYLTRDLLVRHNGSEIDKTDGFLLIFDRPIDGVHFALAYHDALAELSTELQINLTARVGIHVGEVVLRRNRPEHVARGAKPVELEGLAKPTAARIMSLALGAQTLLTRSAFDLARRGSVGHTRPLKNVEWIEHGAYRFKGIAEAQWVHEVGRLGCAPLVAPPNSEKAWRVTVQSQEEATTWRPAPGLGVPGRPDWRLGRKLGDGDPGELWLARRQKVAVEATLAFDDVAKEPTWRAFLFRLHSGETPEERSPVWKLEDPIACLVITYGEQEGTYAILSNKPLLGGRDASMDLAIADPRVSRRHFEIRREESGYVIRELRTKNGVLVNRVGIDGAQPLRNGDTIKVGQTDLAFYEGIPGDRAGRD